MAGVHSPVPNFAALSKAFLAGTVKSPGMIRVSDWHEIRRGMDAGLR